MWVSYVLIRTYQRTYNLFLDQGGHSQRASVCADTLQVNVACKLTAAPSTDERTYLPFCTSGAHE